MKLEIFVIYDSKAAAFLQPWFLTTPALAVRSFTDLANDPESNICRHADDYTLFNIGTFNDSTAKIDWTSPVTLGCAIQYKKPDQQQTEKPLENQHQYEKQNGPAGTGLNTKTKTNNQDTAD